MKSIRAALSLIAAMLAAGSNAVLAAEGAAAPTIEPCPTVSITSNVKIIVLETSSTQALEPEGISSYAPFNTSACSDLCDVPLVLKSAIVDKPGDVFLVLVGPNNVFWKPAASAGARIVGVMTLKPSSFKIFKRAGILSPEQFTPAVQLTVENYATRCLLDAKDLKSRFAKGDVASSDWVSQSIAASILRSADR